MHVIRVMQNVKIIFVDLFAFVIANLIQTFIAFKGYYNNKKIEQE